MMMTMMKFPTRYLFRLSPKNVKKQTVTTSTIYGGILSPTKRFFHTHSIFIFLSLLWKKSFLADTVIV
jgi:hypothetical protein